MKIWIICNSDEMPIAVSTRPTPLLQGGTELRLGDVAYQVEAALVGTMKKEFTVDG